MIDRQYKLNWPKDEPRTPIGDRRGRSPFSMDFSKAFRELDQELQRFGAVDVVCCHNDNRRGSNLKDAAAALYFKLGGRDISICCDLYFDVQDNIRAIGKIVEAMRTIERYGGQHLSQKSFTGFVALPPPKDCWKTLNISKGVGESLNARMRKEYVTDAFRSAVKNGHGAGEDMAVLVDARDQAAARTWSRVMGAQRLPNVRRGRMTDQDKLDIERLAGSMQKPTPGKIARSINRHPATVNWFMLTRGLIERVPRRAPGQYQRGGKTIYPYTEEHDARIEELRTAGKVFREIGEIITGEFGIVRSAHSVQVRLVQLTAAPDGDQ